MIASPLRHLVLGAALVPAACVVPNPDHCLHRAVDSNAWCAEQDAATPYCSPCSAPAHGCVSEEPTAQSCPDYQPSPGSSSGATDGSGGSGSGSGGGSGSGTSGSTSSSSGSGSSGSSTGG